MVLPLLPVVAALHAGGQLVAHSAGGLIVHSTVTGGYVAGTYISTSALAAFLNGTAIAATTVGTAAVGGAVIWAYGTIGGALMSLIGGAGIFGTTIGAKGLIGMLMTIGILPAVPVLIPVVVGLGVLGLIVLVSIGILRARSVRRLRKKVSSASDEEELQFSPREAKTVERILRSISKPHNLLWRKWMQFLGRKHGKA